MRICFFGIYNPEYSRNRVLMSGLKQNGVEVVGCRTEFKGFKKYWDLMKKHWKIRKEYDILFVAFPGYQTMILAKFLTLKPIVFDSFASIYDSEVNDRRKVKKNSLKAKYLWFLDWFSCKLADKILLDTNEQIKFFVKEFGIKKEKFIRVFVGADIFLNNDSNKESEEDKKLKILFYGSNIPLQGVNYIIDSIKNINDEDIEFDIIGSSIKKDFGKETLRGVNFLDNLSYDVLLEKISKSDICLGIFGDTDKTQRVIPNKVFDYIKFKKPVITADTPAVRELFNENDLFLVPSANSDKIAEAILTLKNNANLRKFLSENGYKKFIENCTPKIIVKNLLKELIY